MGTFARPNQQSMNLKLPLPVSQAVLSFSISLEDKTVELSIDDSPIDQARCTEVRAQDLLSRHSHFHNRACEFEFECQQHVLVVRGRVPTFYLMQVLQTVLKDLDGVSWVDNQVDVISSDSVSSVRWRSRRSAD